MSISTTIRLSEELREKIEKYAHLEHHTISEQIPQVITLASTGFFYTVNDDKKIVYMLTADNRVDIY